MRIFELTENRRINELVGFIGVTLGVLLALSLLSYSPQDASFNVSAPPPIGGPAHNWIGPVGAHVADLFFQGLGYAAFLFPVGLLLLAVFWFRSKKVEAPVAKVIGAALFVFALPAEFSLVGLPDVRGALPPGGMLGEMVAQMLRAGFNSIGSQVVSIACIVAGLFLT
ncbi:MAG: DNA translocase FtsK 4TM domain-containing protein, partial [Candidatus Acidiferrales bacterium]